MIKSGIYCITNLVNNKCYIGQSINVKYRLTTHKKLLSTNKSRNKKLQNAFNKYGKDSFEYKVLEYCKIEDLDNKEILYIKNFCSVSNGYNIEYGGNKNKIISEETKLKQSLAKKGKPSLKKGTKISDELRLKLSIAHKGLTSPKKGIKTNKPAWNSGKKGLQVNKRKIKINVINTVTKENLGIFESKQKFCQEINYKSKNFYKIDNKFTKLGVYMLESIE